ncbi:MAG TPA: peptidylprolyl isomerase [Burkholderiales bacterium]|nr:peptidylprolyl isomerase [Burkholderiales bacterium]
MKLSLVAAALVLAPLVSLAQDKPAPKAAAKGAAAKDTGPVATVNGTAIPRSRLDFMMQQQMARGGNDSPETRNLMRDNLIARELITQEAQKSGVAKSADVQVKLDYARQQVLIDAFIEDYVKKNPVSDADVQKEYDRAKAQTGDKEYKARHILVESEEQAKQLIADLRKGGKFDDLAAKHSKDTSNAQRGGDLDWNVPSNYHKAFSDAMVKLEKGKYSDAPVRTPFGFHIIQLDDVRPVKFPALAEVKPQIQRQLTQNKIETLVKDLRAKAKVE